MRNGDFRMKEIRGMTLASVAVNLRKHLSTRISTALGRELRRTEAHSKASGQGAKRG